MHTHHKKIKDTKEVKRQLNILSLTPEDFSVVMRKIDLLGGDITENSLIKLLQQECEFKETPVIKVGFY